MNTQQLFSILITCGCVGLTSPALSQTMTSPNYGINWDVSAGGGGTLMSSNYTLSDSVAQPGASGESVSLGYVHKNGFATPPDDDSDGVKSFMDHCILHANGNQYDSNGDGFGNRCDPDFDNSGVVNLRTTPISLTRS